MLHRINHLHGGTDVPPIQSSLLLLLAEQNPSWPNLAKKFNDLAFNLAE